MKNKLDDLRNHLFATLEALADKEAPLEIERALAVAHVAQVIVNSAKVENDHIKLTGRAGSGFIEAEPTVPGTPRLVSGRAQSGSK